jgi:CHAD domain-containing protein
MTFRFKRKESVSKAIRRLSCRRMEHAVECLKDCGRAEAVHCARKDIKKVRAVLRIVRTRLPKREFRRLTRFLRQAAKQLAALRDTHIKAKTLRDLKRHFKGQLASEALRHVREELRRDFDEEMKRFGKEKSGRTVTRILNHVAKECKRLKVGGKGWRALEPGIKAAYSEGQKVFQAVMKDSSPENFHTWRKQAKDLWYQVTLLQPVWPEQMDAMAHELETLGEYLGNDHDLFVLRKSVEEKCTSDSNARALEILNGLVEQRHRVLRAAALELGSRFYAEEPFAFCERLAGYWRIWRHEKGSIVRSAAAAS